MICWIIGGVIFWFGNRKENPFVWQFFLRFHNPIFASELMFGE